MRPPSTMRRVAMVVAAMAALVACSDGDPPSPGVVTSSSGASGDTSDPTVPPTGSVPMDQRPSTTDTGGSAAPPEQQATTTCARTLVAESGRVESAELVEASGLVASRRHPGVLWSHNDGADGRVFAVDATGSDLASYALGVDGLRDVEDIALVGGVDGDVLLLADIGDNGIERDTIAVHLVDEPDPARDDALGPVSTLTLRYPDGPHDAETLLVDERAGRIVVVTQEQQRDADGAPDPFGVTLPSLVFEAPLDAPADVTVELALVGEVDTVALEERLGSLLPHPSTVLGFGGVVTGGDVAPDGSLVALRTYEAVWLWPRRSDQSVAEAIVEIGEFPCRVEHGPEAQGEAVAFLGDQLVTLGEGSHRPIHLLAG
jgi:hypothetical protein